MANKDVNNEYRRYMKLRQKINLTQAAYDYYDLMVEDIAPMLLYPSLPENGIEMGTLIENAAAAGVAGVTVVNGKYRCGFLTWSDVPDDNGIAKTCVISGGYWSVERKTDEIAYFRFTHSQRPANHLKWFARQFANVDDSQRCLVRNTKYTPMPVVESETIARQYEDALKRQQNGEEITVIVNPAVSPVFRDAASQKENDRVLSIGDASMIEKMHFLSEYHAELKKRFGAMHGMCFKSSAKSAQESVDEIHGMDNFSLIIPYNMREEMRLFADKCARLWPGTWKGAETVKFSELWQREDESAADASKPDEKPAEKPAENEKGGEENAGSKTD